MTTSTRHWIEIALVGLMLAAQSLDLAGQESPTTPKSLPDPPQEHPHVHLDGALIYDYDPFDETG